MPVWDTLKNIFDGNWVDLVTFGVAILYAVFMCRRMNLSLISRQAGLRVAHGVALFPLLLLACSSVSTHALDALVHSHKIILSVAGVVALLALLEEGPPA